MKTITGALLLLAFLVAQPVAQADDGWKRFDFDKNTTYLDPWGNEVSPRCSGAPVPTDGPYFDEAETRYSLFYRPGDYRKLAIFFDGGGACWDPHTCIGSAAAGNPIYDPIVDETVDELNATQGLAANDNPDNPIAGYFQVFIPYCTADLHVGTRTTEYPFGDTFWPINHTGRENVAAVLGWLVGEYERAGKGPPRTVVVAGASAGGYGAMVNYPAIDDLLPNWTKKRVFVDSANGIINQDFYDEALDFDGVWGVWANLPPELHNAFGSGPDALPTALNQTLGWNYPGTRFGQYTSAFDAVQIFYLNVAKYLDDPQQWENPLLLVLTGLEWTAKARINMFFSALTTFNYRYYLGTGSGHTIVPDNRVYAEMSGSGILLTDWLNDMIYRRFLFGGDWQNASCEPNCAP